MTLQTTTQSRLRRLHLYQHQQEQQPELHECAHYPHPHLPHLFIIIATATIDSVLNLNFSLGLSNMIPLFIFSDITFDIITQRKKVT